VSSASARHRKRSPVVSALQNRSAKVAAAAVAGSALMVAAWPAVGHWMTAAPQHGGGGQADGIGLVPTGARRTPAGQPAALAAERAIQQVEFVSIGVARNPGRHRKPVEAQPGQTQPSQAQAQPSPAHAGYLDPLRAVSGLTPERIDQGVDFFGSGPVYAIGDAVITNASTNSGWPGGGWITYQLTDGPDSGLMVYLAEDVTPDVQVGEHVSSSTVIANMFTGADGIETGWADPQGVGALSDLAEAGGIGANGPFPTMVGLSFDGLLQSLGVPAAPNAGQSGSGLLPPGYPAA
jgi:murein DD-endopeptidase MepM/ murein hydrolase activator NlpD